MAIRVLINFADGATARGIVNTQIKIGHVRQFDLADVMAWSRKARLNKKSKAVCLDS